MLHAAHTVTLCTLYLLNWRRNFFNHNPADGVPAGVRVSAGGAGAVADVEFHLHEAGANVATETLDRRCAVNVEVGALVNDAVDRSGSRALGAIEREVPAFAARGALPDAQISVVGDAEESCWGLLREVTPLKRITGKIFILL